VATPVWAVLRQNMRLLLGGLVVSVTCVIVFSSVGLPAKVASVLVAIAIVPLLAAVLLGQVRLRQAAMATPGGQAWRRLPLALRLAPVAVFLLAVPTALLLRAQGVPRYWRTVAFLTFAAAAVMTQRRIQRRWADRE
jgi:hypothetical protein